MFSVKTGIHFPCILPLSNEILRRVISQSKPLISFFLSAFSWVIFNSCGAVQERLLLPVTTQVLDSWDCHLPVSFLRSLLNSGTILKRGHGRRNFPSRPWEGPQQVCSHPSSLFIKFTCFSLKRAPQSISCRPHQTCIHSWVVLFKKYIARASITLISHLI